MCYDYSDTSLEEGEGTRTVRHQSVSAESVNAAHHVLYAVASQMLFGQTTEAWSHSGKFTGAGKRLSMTIGQDYRHKWRLREGLAITAWTVR